MMLKAGLVLFVLNAFIGQSGPFPSGEEILRKVDANLSSNTKWTHTVMIVQGRRGSRTIEARSWIQGEEKSFTEYLAPPREKGTKMLKLGDRLWIYTPHVDRVIRIAGHMLRQSVMGSDLSYEDLMEDPRLTENYEAEVIREEKFHRRSCWVLELKAKKTGLAYPRRLVWVDKQRWLPLREERFAKSGLLLKTFEILEVMQLEGRWYPKKMRFKDELKNGAGTIVMIKDIRFDVAISPERFSLAALRR